MKEIAKLLWPLIIGMACARTGLIVACYGSYSHTDEGIFTDGAMLVSLVALAMALLLVTRQKQRISDNVIHAVTIISVVVSLFCLLALAAVSVLEASTFALEFPLCVIATIAATLSMFYWLRCMTGAGTLAAATFVFAALIVSEVLIYLCCLLPIHLGNLAAAVVVGIQFPLMRKRIRAAEGAPDASFAYEYDYFSFAKTVTQSHRALIATAFGIGLLALVDGFLRGYPDGLAIAFTPQTRIAYGLLTVAVSSWLIHRVVHRSRRVMTAAIFVVMETLACIALIAYAAFPGTLEIGAVFTTTLNALMCAYCWYVIIAFSSYGWRDPMYYAIGGWIVCFGARGLARIALLGFYPLTENVLLINAIMGALVVLSTQVVFLKFLIIEKDSDAESPAEECAEAAKPAAEASALTKLMGLDGQNDLSSMRAASMRESAEVVGRQFLLTEREVDVLALYALGHTQKRVAEELFITQSTAHAHIKRIYTKTGMHSRQEILDYIATYAS